MTLFRVILVRIQSECGKLQTRITPNTDTFHAILACVSNGHLGIIYSYNYNLPEYSCSKHWADKLFVIFWEKVTSVNRKSLISVPDHESRLWENYFIRLAFFTKEYEHCCNNVFDAMSMPILIVWTSCTYYFSFFWCWI